ncbi:MAG TPA: HisA/HisF-related TIM barrel protein [Candidatus Limnocylindrales bacterium]|nr:HisA/HisF-related TIM barrel protein [Candidatus Limnocylindrales bacterium]
MAEFELIPAIDLRGGRVVRLVEGDFERSTDYSDDPVAVAIAFATAGARWIHVVDLDGALEGRPVQAAAVEAIAASLPAGTQLEFGGGLRTEGDVRALLAIVGRVVVGTGLLADPAFAARLVRAHGHERIVAALDVRHGRAVGDGWRHDAQALTLEDAWARARAAGIRRAIVTAIARDGSLGGPDLELLGSLATAGGIDVVASGGIRNLDDVLAVRAIGCAGAIVGRAIYERTLDLAAAFDRLTAEASGVGRPA